MKKSPLGLFSARSGSSATGREIGLFGFSFLIFAIAEFYFGKSLYLFRHLFWLDELYTYQLVADPSLSHAMHALWDGADGHPPTLYLLMRLFTFIIGRCDEVSLRAFSLLFIILAMTGLYGILRQRFGRLASMCAVMAVWSHPIVMTHAFEARVYAPWLAFAIWLCFFWQRYRAGEEDKLTLAMLALTSSFLCVIHYFGIVSLFLLVGAELALSRPPFASVQKGLMALLAGPVLLIFLIPMARHQGHFLTVKTWVPPFEVLSAKRIFWQIIPRVYFACLVPWLVEYSMCFFRFKVSKAVQARQTALAPMVGAVMMIVFVFVFSRFIFSIMVSRYAIVAVLAIGPSVAYILSRLPGLYQCVILFLLIAANFKDYHAEAANYYNVDDGTKTAISALRALPAEIPVVYEHAHILFVVNHYAPDLVSQGRILDFENEDFPAANYSALFSRDYARGYEKIYGAPKLVPWQKLRNSSVFYMLPGDWVAYAESSRERLEDAFPAYAIKYIGNGIFRFDKKGQPKNLAASN